MINYDGRKFRSVSNSAAGDVGDRTFFYYRQKDRIVWGDYYGGTIVRGNLVGKVDEAGNLEMVYQHVTSCGQFKTGYCRSKPEVLPDNRLRLHEIWRWTTGDSGNGESIIEELVL